ncbi:MAG: hypothetical protein ACLUIX_03445 [Oscillospiraceae bacterium]
MFFLWWATFAGSFFISGGLLFVSSHKKYAKTPKRRRWRMQQGGFEEVSRFSRRANGWKPAEATVDLSVAMERKAPAGGRKSCWELCAGKMKNIPHHSQRAGIL